MENWLLFPEPAPAIRRRATAENAQAVRNWLWIVAALVFLMVIVGGATRLTESGLSIVEWKPITGVIPPLNDREWEQAFDDYQQIPQYKELFPDMTLSGFKYIYAWEWGHRLLGRLIGVVFLLPMIFFWTTRRLPAGLKPRLLGILALGALQGGVGWWMVSSGLIHRTEVAQERLAIHLLIAALIISACMWVAGGLGPQKSMSVHEHARRLKIESLILLGSVFMQIFIGGLVAGLRAGLVNNSWPLIDGSFIPPMTSLWSLEPAWLNLVDNPLTVQFLHRMVGYVIFILAAVHLVDAAVNSDGKVRSGAVIVFLHILAQIALGVTTLLVLGQADDQLQRFYFSLAHQAVGIAVIIVVTLQARRLCRL
jgi:cytochrome c oxidase assembly protein subunit 15